MAKARGNASAYLRQAGGPPPGADLGDDDARRHLTVVPDSGKPEGHTPVDLVENAPQTPPEAAEPPREEEHSLDPAAGRTKATKRPAPARTPAEEEPAPAPPGRRGPKPRGIERSNRTFRLSDEEMDLLEDLLNRVRVACRKNGHRVPGRADRSWAVRLCIALAVDADDDQLTARAKETEA